MDGVYFQNEAVQRDGSAAAAAVRTAPADFSAQWERIAQRLRSNLGEDLYSSWFARMDIEQFQDGRLVVSLPTRFLRNWIVSHYSDTLAYACEAELGSITALCVQVRTRGLPVRALPQERPQQAFATAGRAPTRDIAQRHDPSDQAFGGYRDRSGSDRSGDRSGDRGSPLDHSLTFETFVVGRSNALAHAAAMRIAEAPSGQPLNFNPLFIHSAAGLGKTHLLNAVSWRVRQRTPNRNVVFITAERFMYHFLAALKARDVLSFKDYFQSVDVLIIDDLQFLQGKSMQQEFYHTFNSLVDSKRQVIVAADVPPAQLESIDQRMRSRLAGGLVVDIEGPELELRRDILKVRLTDARRKDTSFQLADDVVEFIANRITGGGRELEGALNRVIARYELTRSPVTIELAALALRDLAQAAEPARVRIDDILKVVGRHYNVPRADLLSPRRAQSIVRPRQVGMYLAKKLTSRSLPEIGRRFGGRDHSTVLHAVRKIEELMQSDDRLAREVALLMRLIEHQ